MGMLSQRSARQAKEFAKGLPIGRGLSLSERWRWVNGALDIACRRPIRSLFSEVALVGEEAFVDLFRGFLESV